MSEVRVKASNENQSISSLDREHWLHMYEQMFKIRIFEEQVNELYQSAKMPGLAHLYIGEEAVAVGIASAMQQEDVLLPSYRDNAALLWRGVNMEDILLYWGGDERGNHGSGPAHDFPFCIPVGSQAPHAAGVGYAFKYRKEARVAVCMFGDGATSKGDVRMAELEDGMQLDCERIFFSLGQFPADDLGSQLKCKRDEDGLIEVDHAGHTSVENVFAAGDHLNYLPMLDGQFAACVAAPDNAVPEVKEIVRRQKGYISHQPWGHGVARGLEYYLEQALK